MNKIDIFIKSQKSIHLYKNVQRALKDVLSKLSDKEFKLLTKDLIIVALHEGALAQVMHFNKIGNFKIMQLIIPKNIPFNVLKFVIAHELGHVKQNRNWQKNDGSKLEIDADDYASSIGFPKTKDINKWIKNHKK